MESDSVSKTGSKKFIDKAYQGRIRAARLNVPGGSSPLPDVYLSNFRFAVQNSLL